MSGSNARSNAIRAITSYKPDLAPLNYADTKPTEIYGSNVFSDKVMKERLPRIVYKSLRKTIEQCRLYLSTARFSFFIIPAPADFSHTGIRLTMLLLS